MNIFHHTTHKYKYFMLQFSKIKYILYIQINLI